MFASLKSVVPTNGKGGLASAGSLFPFDEAPPTTVTLESFLAAHPQFAARIITALLALAMCDNAVRPQRLCGCGCGAFVTGKATLASAACRKRVERERSALRAASGDRQYFIPLQSQIGSPLPPAKKL